MSDERLPDDEVYDPTVHRTGRADGDRETDHIDSGSLVSDGGLEISEFMEVLAHERRRYVLYYLQHEECAELEDVTEQIAVWESGTPSEELDERTRRRISINLYHAQLPKLEEAGIIGYDRRHGSMCFQYPPDPVEKFLDYCAAIELPEPIG